MNVDFLNILILFGAIQGFISAVLLFKSQKNKRPNRLLAWILIFLSLACLNLYLLETITEITSLFLQILEATVPMIIIMPLGPLVYLYVRALLNPAREFTRNERLHFAPTLLDILPNILAVFFILGAILRIEIQFSFGEFSDSYQKYLDIPRWISLTVYVTMAARLLKPHINQGKKHIKWVKYFVGCFAIFQGVWLLHLVPYIVPSFSNRLLEVVGWYPLYIPIVILVYWLGINGILQSRSAFEVSPNSLTDGEADKLLYQLQQTIQQDQLFLNPSLSLGQLVKQSGIPQKKISAVLNQHEGKSFNEFINEFRVEEVKRRLITPDHQHLTMVGVALECGFNSQATFQRVFKSVTNQSPREFRAKQQETSVNNGISG